jgi:hypothetical protein
MDCAGSRQSGLVTPLNFDRWHLPLPLIGAAVAIQTAPFLVTFGPSEERGIEPTDPTSPHARHRHPNSAISRVRASENPHRTRSMIAQRVCALALCCLIYSSMMLSSTARRGQLFHDSYDVDAEKAKLESGMNLIYTSIGSDLQYHIDVIDELATAFSIEKTLTMCFSLHDPVEHRSPRPAVPLLARCGCGEGEA